MRRMYLLAIIAAIIATPAIIGSAARAEVVYPWCALYANGTENCGFTSQSQCRAAVSGVGGFCTANPAAAYRRR